MTVARRPGIVFVIPTAMLGVVALALVLTVAPSSFGDPLPERGRRLAGEPPQRPRLQLTIEQQQELWKVVNNSLVPVEQRAKAERSLIGARDVRMLHSAFRGLIEPIEVIHPPDPGTDGEMRVEHMSITEGMGHFFPSGGTPEADARAPVAAQIAYCRSRIWYHLAMSAAPEGERHALYAQLIDEARKLPEANREKDWLIGTLVRSSSSNWTQDVRTHLLSIYRNPERTPTTRRSVRVTLGNMGHATPRPEFERARELFIATAWAERGTAFAREMTEWLVHRHDPRCAVLFIDRYEHARSVATERRPLSKNLLDLMDSYFGNISGMHVEHRVQQERTIAIIRQRDELTKEAKETGDDTKLREFEAELAAKQKAELEERIEKIDAWIAGNRERLEAEAEAYARGREVLRRPPADE